MGALRMRRDERGKCMLVEAAGTVFHNMFCYRDHPVVRGNFLPAISCFHGKVPLFVETPQKRGAIFVMQ